MKDFLLSILLAMESHFGILVAVALGIYLVICYARGELSALFTFIKDMLSGPDGRPSTKNAGYFMGAAVLCWSFAKITLATCRRIDHPVAPLDPTTIFIAELGVIATLVGVMYLGGKALMSKVQGILPSPEPSDPPAAQP